MASRILVNTSLVAALLSTSLAAAGDVRLIDAVRARNLDRVRALLAERVNVNAPQGDGATALHWAVHLDDMPAVETLIRAGARPDVADDTGATPLYLACVNRSPAVVSRLLAAGANPNAALLSGETVLMTCSRAGEAAAVRALLDKGALVNARESAHNQTALMWAAAQSHSGVVGALLERGADVRARSREYTQTVTSEVTQRAGREELNYTVPRGGSTALLFAARSGDTDTARLLLAAGADVNDRLPDGASALVVAAHSGQGAFAKMLLDKGADANAAGAGYTALHAAVLRGDLDLVKALLAHGANPNAPLAKGTPSRYYSKDWALNASALVGSTPLWQAARYGDVPVMRALAAAGADPKVAHTDRSTILIVAVAANSGYGTGDRRERYLGPGDTAPTPEENERVTYAAAAAAIELGADVNATNQAGETALHVAAAQAVDSVARLLVEKGANIEATNKRGLTPLGVAIAPRPRNPLQIDGPDRRASTAAVLRKLGAKEPDPALLKPQAPQMPGAGQPGQQPGQPAPPVPRPQPQG
jgi:ankyrin repeat protein